jgi:hypothetical protein
MKIVSRILILVVLLLIVGGAILYFSIDRIIKSTVQTQATNSLNLNTTLDSANLSLVGGSLKLNGLNVASPAGFSTGPMFQLGQAALSVNYSQLSKETIHVADISITGPVLLMEYTNGKLNLNAAVDQMPKSSDESSSSSSTGSGSNASSSSDSSKQVKLIIDSLTVSGANVIIHPGTQFPGMPAELTVPLPDLTIKNIGNGDGANNGAAIKDVVLSVVNKMAQSALQSDAIKGEFKQMALGQLGNLTKSLPGNVGSALGDLTSNPKNAMGDLVGKGGSSPTSQPASQIKNLMGGLMNGKN